MNGFMGLVIKNFHFFGTFLVVNTPFTFWQIQPPGKKLAGLSPNARPSLCLSGVLRYSLLRIPKATAGENKKFSGDNMKKLISVFAALALVGAASAQAPAMAAKKGMGLFVEGRGVFTLGGGTSDSQVQGSTGGTSQTYQLPNTKGFGGGATLGFNLAEGFALVASYDYRSIKSREWEQTTDLGANGTLTKKINNTTNSQVLGFGFRPSAAAFGGTVYAGMGFAFVLPNESTTTVDFTCSTAATCGTLTKQTTTEARNSGIGAYGELGYNYSINDMVYVGLGFRVVMATSNNDGKSKTVVNDGTAAGLGVTAGTTTTDYSSTKDATHTQYTSTGITDMGVNIQVGARF
jgi:hypothetical protein